MTNKIQQQAGFTLLELMICVSIAMTLITVAIPKYQDYMVQTKYMSAITQLSADKNAIIDRAIQNGFSFSSLPEEELDSQGMQTHFALNDNAEQKYLDGIGGKKASDYDFMLYQFVDKEGINAPEIAPEMIAMAVVVEESGAFSYHCHYYHSELLWDYDGGDKYTSLDCDSSSSRASGTAGNVTSDNTEGSTESDVSGSTSSPQTSTGSDTDSSANTGSLSTSESNTDSSTSNSSGSDTGTDTDAAVSDGSAADRSNNQSDEPCNHGEKVKGNNGHGNNVDGIDSSNPGRENNKKKDASCSGKNCVDDEKGRKK